MGDSFLIEALAIVVRYTRASLPLPSERLSSVIRRHAASGTSGPAPVRGYGETGAVSGQTHDRGIKTPLFFAVHRRRGVGGEQTGEKGVVDR